MCPPECLPELQRVSHAIAEIANIAPDDHQAYVGPSAFAHKAGLHASAIKVSPELYNHLDPAVVGNDMRILVTEMAGRASVELKGRELGVDLAGQADAIGRVVDQVKELEADGWSFEAADASFELLLRAELPDAPQPLFELECYRTSVEHWGNGVVVSEATVKVHLDGERIIAPPRATARSTRSTTRCARRWSSRYPHLAEVALADYKVRILGWKGGTSATTRVLIDTTDGVGEWTTVGVHANVVEASWHALVDALTYAVRHRARARRLRRHRGQVPSPSRAEPLRRGLRGTLPGRHSARHARLTASARAAVISPIGPQPARSGDVDVDDLRLRRDEVGRALDEVLERLGAHVRRPGVGVAEALDADAGVAAPRRSATTRRRGCPVLRQLTARA